MKFFERLKKGMEIGIKARALHTSPQKGRKFVERETTKWTKKKAKEERKAAKRKH